jgi:hypothetical protein
MSRIANAVPCVPGPFQVRPWSVPGLRRAPDAVRFARFLQAPVRGLARALGAPRRPLGASERPVRTRALRRFALTLRGMSRSCSRRSRPRRAVVVPDRRPPRRPAGHLPSRSARHALPCGAVCRGYLADIRPKHVGHWGDARHSAPQCGRHEATGYLLTQSSCRFAAPRCALRGASTVVMMRLRRGGPMGHSALGPSSTSVEARRGSSESRGLLLLSVHAPNPPGTPRHQNSIGCVMLRH